MPATMEAKLSSVRIRSAASRATSVAPLPMATPMPAACSAGAVVDSVAGNRDDLSLPAQAFHDRRFLQRLGAGEHPRLRHHRVELRAVPPGEIGVPWKGAEQSAFSTVGPVQASFVPGHPRRSVANRRRCSPSAQVAGTAPDRVRIAGEAS
jgi:hypothetical protein